ncbi:MAG TPA: hypothetical protein VHV83_17715 [Armatimonadota bacterium]|nr:hypothetical protein [Armatimonadota bacterium]
MWTMVMHLLQEPLFWVRVLVCCTIWYGLACIMGHSFMEGDPEPQHAASHGAWFSLWIVLLVTSFVSWLWWRDVMLTSLLATMTFLLPALVLIVLTRLDADVEG